MSRIVAAERAADQQRPTEVADGTFQLSDGLPWMVVQFGYAKLIAQAQSLHQLSQLCGFFRQGRAVEPVYIKQSRLILIHAVASGHGRFRSAPIT